MNPTLAILLTLLRSIKPEDVAVILTELTKFLDPIIATKGPLVRFAWSILKGVLPTLAGDVHAEAAKIVTANPQIVASAI